MKHRKQETWEEVREYFIRNLSKMMVRDPEIRKVIVDTFAKPEGEEE